MAHDHAHGHGRGAGNERRIVWAMLLTGGFMLAEVAGGVLSGSLTLLADAGHMLTDFGALGLAYAGMRFARRPADPQRSYGYHRLEVLAAFVNGLTLIAIVVWIAIEAVRRLFAPVEVLSSVMLAIALLGLAVNLAAFAILRDGDRTSINLQGALLHVVGDLLGSIAAVVAALVIAGTGWTPIDPVLSLLVALLILRSGWAIVRQSGHVLLEGTPEEIDVARLRAELPRAVPGLDEVHHVHAWSLTAGRILLTLHGTIAEGADHDCVLHAVKDHLEREFRIEHSVIQLETRPACPDQPSAWAERAIAARGR